MNTIFYECLSLKESEFSNFITNNVEGMNNMFNECLSLIKLNLSKLKADNINNM